MATPETRPGDNNPVDVLIDIRNRLGEMPEKLAEQLRHGRQTRWGAAGSDGASASDGSRGPLHAVEGLLGAAAPFVPAAGELASNLRAARELVEAWQHLAGLFRSAPAEHQLASDVTVTSPIPEAMPRYEGYAFKPSDWLPPDPPVTVAPPVSPFALEPESEAAAAMAPSVTETPATPTYQPYQLHPEQWLPPSPVQAPALPTIEPLSLKPEDWRPQPFEVMPQEQWAPPGDAPEPSWMRLRPEIGFADYQPQEAPQVERPEASALPSPAPIPHREAPALPQVERPEPAALPTFSPMPHREASAGWADVKPLMPLSAQQGWQDIRPPAAQQPWLPSESPQQTERQRDAEAPAPETFRMRPKEWPPPEATGRAEPWKLANTYADEPFRQSRGRETDFPLPERDRLDLLGDNGDAGREDIELLRAIKDVLEKIASQDTKRDTGQLPVADDGDPAGERLAAAAVHSAAPSGAHDSSRGLVKHLAKESILAAAKSGIEMMLRA